MIYTYSDGPIYHPLYDEMHKRLLAYLMLRPQPRIYLLLGPTGVGKTSIAEEIERDIIENYSGIGNGAAPCVYVSAASADNRVFSFKDLYLRLLAKLDEPFVGNKMPYHISQSGQIVWNRVPIRERAKYTLRLSVERALHERQCKVLLIDEAQSMVQSRTAKAAYSAVETLKTFLNSLGINLVLIGNDELLDMTQYSDQFNRRIKTMVMSPYDVNNEEQLNQFVGIINSFSAKYRLKTNINIMDSPHLQFLITESLGCIGLLCDLLDDMAVELDVHGADSMARIKSLVKLNPTQAKVIADRRAEFDNALVLGKANIHYEKRSADKPRKRVEPKPERRLVAAHGLDKAEPTDT